MLHRINKIVLLITFLACASAAWGQVAPAPGVIIYWTDDGAYTTDTNFSGGTGTEADPWVITTAADLARLSKLVSEGDNMVGKYFVQRGDIDLSSHRWTPIGKNDTYTFLGNYDGMGHTIVNMTINETYDDNYPVSNKASVGFGLFGSVNGISDTNNPNVYSAVQPVLKNIVLVDPSISLTCAGRNKYTRVGLLVGGLGNNSTLQNCNVQGGKITITNHKGLSSSANMFIGGAVGDCAPGFAGYATNSTPIIIKNISIDADITVTPTGTATEQIQGNYQYNAGGIVGRMRYSKGPLLNCYYTGKIDAQQFTVSPSYGAVRNNASSSTIASIMAGQFYDAAERTGEEVYFGDYKVWFNGDYRTITGNPSAGYTFTPKSNGEDIMNKNTVSGINVWTFGTIPTTQPSTAMAGAQGVNSCDSWVSDIDAVVGDKSLVDKFNNNVAAEMQHLFQWVNHDGKPHLHRKDDATMDSTMVDTNHQLTIVFNDDEAGNKHYHWTKTIDGVETPVVNDNATITIPDKSLVDVVWSAYVSYTIGVKEYHSNTVTYTQKKNVNALPSISLAGSRTDNTLTLTATVDKKELTIDDASITYHWTKGGDADSHTTASFPTEAFTAEDVDWEVYASYTFEGDAFNTEPAKYTQTRPGLTLKPTIENDILTQLTVGFDTYGGVLTEVKYYQIKNTYADDGTLSSSETTEITTNPIPATVVFEEKIWHIYAEYKHNTESYRTDTCRYAQQPSPLPTLTVTKDESNISTLVMDASLSPSYTGLTNIKYHWSKNGEEQTDHYKAHREVGHAFDTQYWRCWATFEANGKEYRSNNDEVYTYYSTLGHLNFHADPQPNGTILATLNEAGSIASNVTIAYTWKDSQGNTGTGTSYTRQNNAEWVEFIATITDKNNVSNQLIKYAVYRFPDAERNVVFINYTGGANGNDANTGLTPETPVKTWKRAYELLDDTGWEKNIIVIVHGTGTNNMIITEQDAGATAGGKGKAATITGEWPWTDTAETPFTPNDATTGRIYVSAATSVDGNGARIGAATRFRNVVFWATAKQQNRLSCWLHDTYFDTGVVMKNFDDLETNAGAIAGRKSPHFHLQLYADQLAKDEFPQKVDEHMTLTIRSGQIGRILASRIAGTKAKNTYIIGRHNNPLKAVINIDIQDVENNKKAGGKDYTDDIGYIASGLTQGMIYGDITMNITRGSIATLVAASQGNALKMGSLNTPVSTFCGRTTVNINANDDDVIIQNYYGGCQGRVYGADGVCDAFLYGQSTLNMNGGTIKANVFASSAGISGLRSADPNYFAKGWYTPDKRIPYPGTYAYGVDYLPYDRNKRIVTMTNTKGEDIDLSDTEIVVNIQRGKVEGNVYGGSYGYSDPLENVNYAPAHAGRLFGNTSVNISGGTIGKEDAPNTGNVYGGGAGSTEYFNKATTDARRRDFLDVAQVYGTTHVTVTGNPTIAGNIYGGGAGIAYQAAGGGKTENEFLDIAKVYGSTNVTIDADPAWEFRGNIYGGGALGAVEGTTTVRILSGILLGNVFGGGKGEEGHSSKAKVTGATKVMTGNGLSRAAGMPKVMILGNAYGGGELAQVIAPDAETAKAQLIQDRDLATLFTTHADHEYTTYVRLGTESEVYGRVFGGGKGQHDDLGESAGRVTGQTDVALDGATVWSEIYGGGEMADVRGNTLLHFIKGKAGHNAFGGGLGKLTENMDNGIILPDNRQTVLASADVKLIPNNYDLIINDNADNLTALKALDLNTPVNWMAGKITGESFVVFDGTEDSYTHYEFKKARTVNRDGNGDPVKINDLYYTETDQYNPARPGQLFSINHNIYGGGMTASQVEGKTFVYINYGMVDEEMMEYEHAGKKVWSTVYNSIANAQFCVFGGGYGYYADILGDTNITMDIQGDGQYKYIEEFTEWFAGPGKEKYGWDTNVGRPELIYAAADEATWSHGAPGRSCMDIVGGGYNGRVHGSTNVTVGGDVVLRKVYGGGYYSSVGNTNVLLKSGIFNRVYGGGMIGNVYGKATLNFGQKGSYGTIKEDNVHLMVKDAIYGGNDVSGTVGTSDAVNHTNAAGVTYNVYNPVDADNKGVRLNIYGGLVLGDVYGAGNGNHPGYGNPDYMEFNLSQHPSENYRQLAHPGTRGTNLVYKYRPRTGRVVMNIEGNDGVDFNDDPLVDKVRIWGRTFGGGNSCNVGVWNGQEDDNTEVYADDGSSWHPGDNFQGGGTIKINIGSHVQLGNRNDSHETPNGLFMGSNGEHMITQHTDKELARYYHQYWDSKAGKYYPGFVVYEDDAVTPIKRNVGLKAFGAFINNILTKSDDVHLNIDENAKDVWMSNFVGGGYRGSMQAKTAAGKFSYTLPTGVTIGHSVVGGAFNAHIIYRVYATNYGDGTYKTDSEGNYIYETVEPDQGVRSKAEAEAYDIEQGNPKGTTPYDYIKKLYAEGHEGDENYKTGYLRYNFDGGIMGHESGYIATANGSRCNQVRNGAFDFTSPTKYDKSKALVYLNLRNKLDPLVTEAHDEVPATVHGGIVYGGCFHSGYIDGDVWVDYRCSLSPLCKGKDTRFFDKTNDDLYGNVDNLEVHNALNVFGAGYGEDTHTMGDTYLRILHNGSSDDSYDYPFVYNVFGGGNMGTVAGNTNVYYNVGGKGTVMGSLYGGGYKGTIDGNTFVELAGGLIINAYGGSREANIGGATHVWAYDGANRPEGEDEPEATREKAPLLIGNIYGGNDISGTIGTAADESGVEAQWSVSKWGALSGKKFNSYVQVGGTETTHNGYPLVGNIFAGGNGEKTAVGVPAPDIAKTLLEIDGGTTLRAFGGGNKATVTKDAYILVAATEDVFTNYTFTDVQKKVLMKTVFKGVLNGYRWEESTLKMDPYHVVKMYGGNNVATMNIQPTWGLKDGLIENVYSGGNMGDMTYYNEHGTAATTNGELATTTIGVENNADGTNANYTPRGLCITIDSPDINIKNLFGGCRLSNVVPGGYDNEGNLAQNAAFASCENLYGATINILDGKIENVFGGNDVGGKVYFGTNINISGGILGNVYGSGNGDYLYRFDKNATTVTEQIDEKLGFYYEVPEKMGETLIETAGTVGSDTHKILTINRIRPAVDNTFINIGGMEHNDGPSGSGPKRVAAVKGNIFMGGNATTITRDGNFTFGKFKLGSYTTINGLFLGSDGHSYTDNNFIEQFAKLNDIEDMSAETNFESGHEIDKQHNPILLNAYLMAVDVQSPPKDFSIKAPLTDAYLGTFCGGGNRGSMLHDKTVELDFPADLVIFDKIVAGCMNATVNYNQNGTNVQSLGGYTRPLDVEHNGTNGNTKIKYTINSQFKPLVMDAEFDKVTGKNKHNETLATAMAKGFVYDNLNAGGNAWMTGCNIYGGCYESGVVVGDVELNVTSQLLGHMANNGESIFKNSVKDGMDDGVTNSNDRTKFDNALANGAVIGNIYGAGFGQESDVKGNVRIYMTSADMMSPGKSADQPSANNVYGGGRSGELHGNSYIRLQNGHVYSDVVGGCDAAKMYGSTYIGIGRPTYYECKTSDAYNLTRGDQWNGSKIKQTVYYKAGDFIAPNVWSQMSTADQAKFESHNDMQGMDNDKWAKTDIIVRGGVYGGGFTIASSTTGMAGNYTVLRELDGSGAKTNYGGNSTILVADRGSLGDGDHIRISTHTSANTGDGGIYGDGHLTFCEGFRAADVKGYGYNTGTPHTPRLLNTFQRLDLLDVTDCCLELQGAQDFATNQIDATVYSATRIDELRLNSSLSNSNDLTPLSNTKGTAAAGFSTSKVRNYVGFNNNVHYLGAIVTDDAFDAAMFHAADGTVDSKSYKVKKTEYITAYGTSKDADAFKQRNRGTARNCVGLNSGYCLRVLNLGKDGTTYYGPIVGVAEVKLLTLTQGEGGGYVYADNIHADENNFLNTSGNFVFPGVDLDGSANDQYIVDDCFTTHFGTPDNITNKSVANLDEAHYWYVEGNKYFYNTTLTGYTYKSPPTMEFNLIKNDPNVVLSGLTSGSSLNVKKIEWLSTHRGGYAPVLPNATVDKIDDYEFDFQVADLTNPSTPAFSWTADMPRYTAGNDANPLTTGLTLSRSATPIFNVKLQDKQDNSGDDNYTNHLDEPELVKIYLVGSTTDANSVVHSYEYTITLNIVYLQGPTYEGGVTIENCALPGERIGFSSGGIKIKTPDLMPVTAASWQILPLDEIAGDEWRWDNNHGTVIPPSQYSEDLTGNLSGWIPALYKQHESNIAYIFTAGGEHFPVLPDQDPAVNPLKQNRMIVVHNYHRMKDVYVTDGGGNVIRDLQIETMPSVDGHPDFAEAKLYLEDEADLRAFVNYLNMATESNANHIPVGLAGLDIILQNDITLTQPLPPINVTFAGNFHGDGYHIDLGTYGTSLFGSQLSGQVFNLGLWNGTISSIDTRAANGIVDGEHTDNSYEAVTHDDFTYGRNAYDLSHHFVEHGHDADYVEKYYANGDYQYATTDRVWSLRTGVPNYGFTETHHDQTHTHDAARWIDVDPIDATNPDSLCHTGHNEPLNDGTRVVADIDILDNKGLVIGVKRGIPANYANDYLFFGQHLDKENADAYPVHINPVATGDASIAKGGNRVYKTSGFYGSALDNDFFYNRDAWALHPDLTAIGYTNMTAEPDAATTLPAMFSVDSNKNYDGDNETDGIQYSNATYGHVTQNMLLYVDESNKAIFADGTYDDGTPESDISYHTVVRSSSPSISLDYLHLVDKQDFNAPIDFRVNQRAWYERYPQAYRNVTPVPTAPTYQTPSAWEGITLPFQYIEKVSGEPQTIRGNIYENQLSHFYGEVTPEMEDNPAINDRTLHHEYWLTGLVAADGDKATFARPTATEHTDNFYVAGSSCAFTYENLYYRHLPYYGGHTESRDDDGEGSDAIGTHDNGWYYTRHTFAEYPRQFQGTPYLCAFPGNDFYEFSLEGQKITFEKVGSSIIAVSDVDTNTYGTTTVGSHQHVGTYTHVTADVQHLGINAEGDAFEAGKAILPFRTYMTTTGASPRRRISIGGKGPQEEIGEEPDEPDPNRGLHVRAEHGCIIVTSTLKEQRIVTIVNASGAVYNTFSIEPGQVIITAVPRGIYLVGGKKMAVD